MESSENPETSSNYLQLDESIHSKIMAFLEDPSDKKNAEAALAAVSTNNNQSEDNTPITESNSNDSNSNRLYSGLQVFSKDYWDNYYQDEGIDPFDWYQDYEQLQSFFLQHVKLSDNILMVGCGNSLCSEKMIDDGYKNIINIDLSQMVIDQMIDRNSSIPSLKYSKMDVRKMDFPDKSFDTVIDKGTLDSILSVKGSIANAELMCEEVSRVLHDGGKFLEITYGEPKRRMMHLDNEKFNWTIETFTIPKKLRTEQHTFIYLITKQKS